MARNINQIFIANPASSMLVTDLFYLGRSPFGASNDMAITWANVMASITVLGTIATGVWNGSVIGMTYGGTGKALTPSNGGVVYTDGDSMEIVAPVSVDGKVLQSRNLAAPQWSTPTYPMTSGSAGVLLRSNGTNNVYSTSTFADTYSINTILFASSANTVTGLATAASSFLQTDAGGTPAYQNAATTRTNMGAAASGANTDITSVYLNNTGLKIKDTNASHGLSIIPGSDLTADRNFTLTTGDAARTLTMTGDATLNQNVSTTGSPTFADVIVTSITTANTGLHILDTNASHDLVIVPGSDLTADRNFTITTGDNARTLDVSASNVTVSSFGASIVDDTSNLAVLTTLNVRRGTTAAYGGGGTSNTFTATGVVATDLIFATINASTTATVAIGKVVAGADQITVNFTADPGANTTVQWLAIPTV